MPARRAVCDVQSQVVLFVATALMNNVRKLKNDQHPLEQAVALWRFIKNHVAMNLLTASPAGVRKHTRRRL